ncbi:MAG: hypothetical protein RLZZ455_146 [Candidatus Parcubacteria bacterium]|jgi:LPXTG-site transpeptidase (sortase) family protein
MRLFLARLFLFTGLLCIILLGMLLYQRYRPNPLAFQGAVFTRTLSESTTVGVPAQLSIPSLSLSLPIVSAEIEGTSWETSEKAVSYLKSTPVPGKKGNSVLYGHNWPNLLGPLHQIHIGDLIEIQGVDGSVSVFRVEFITIVTPDQINILENSKDSRITLYTCTGFLDSKRLVVTALKVK